MSFDQKEYHRAWYLAHREEQLAKMRAYDEAHRIEHRLFDRAYNEQHAEERAAYQREYRSTEHGRERRRAYARGNPRVIARASLRYAVKMGRVTRLPCQECGDPQSHGHHHLGYEGENRFNVQWFCRKHHMLLHRIVP